MPSSLKAITLRIAAGRLIQRAEKTDQRHGVLGDLIARVPFSMITAEGDIEAVGIIALTVGEQVVEFVIIIRVLPWAILVIDFGAVKQISRSKLYRTAENAPPIAKHAAFHLEEVLGQGLQKC